MKIHCLYYVTVTHRDLNYWCYTHPSENSDQWKNLLSSILSWLSCLVSLKMLLAVCLVSTSKEMLQDDHCSFLSICHETSNLKIRFSSIPEVPTKTKLQECLRSLPAVKDLLAPLVSNFNAFFRLVLKAIAKSFSIFNSTVEIRTFRFKRMNNLSDWGYMIRKLCCCCCCC